MFISKDSLSLKESLLIAIETIPEKNSGHIKQFISKISNNKSELELSDEMKTILLDCISLFKKTKTFFWLREDFKKALYDLETMI